MPRALCAHVDHRKIAKDLFMATTVTRFDGVKAPALACDLS